MRHVLVAAVAVFALSCSALSPKPSAEEVCKKLETMGIAKSCREVKPLGLSAAARTRIDFDLVSVPGKGGAVMAYDSPEAFRSCVEAHQAAALLVGPHQYGSQKTLIFTQINESLSLEDGKKVRAMIEGL